MGLILGWNKEHWQDQLHAEVFVHKKYTPKKPSWLIITNTNATTKKKTVRYLANQRNGSMPYYAENFCVKTEFNTPSVAATISNVHEKKWRAKSSLGQCITRNTHG